MLDFQRNSFLIGPNFKAMSKLENFFEIIMQLAYALHKSIIRNPKFPKVLLVNRNLKIENQKNLTSVYYLTRGVSSTRVLLDTRVLVDLLLVCYSNLHVERVVADNRYSTLTTRVD